LNVNSIFYNLGKKNIFYLLYIYIYIFSLFLQIIFFCMFIKENGWRIVFATVLVMSEKDMASPYVTGNTFKLREYPIHVLNYHFSLVTLKRNTVNCRTQW